ncbi:MAG: hypothetical protein M3Q87_04280 [Actinomycetota bacterium]|nr:hypothetical protein [Actinomycetota bacterium]
MTVTDRPTRRRRTSLLAAALGATVATLTAVYGFGQPVSGSQLRYNGSHGVLFMSLSDGGYTWQFKTISGAVRDSGSDTCVA